MAMKPNQMLVWIWQPTALDKRVGFVPVTTAEFQMMKSQGRAQDPRVGGFLLKHITNKPFVPPGPAALEPEPQSLGAAATPYRRRRSAPARPA